MKKYSLGPWAVPKGLMKINAIFYRVLDLELG